MIQHSDQKIREIWQKSSEIILAKLEIIDKVTKNTEVKGLFTEQLIWGVIQKWIRPFEISIGTILGIDKQIDGIIWERQSAPVLIEEGNFIVAHPQSVKGIVEIKSSGNPKELQDRLKAIHGELRNLVKVRVGFKGCCGILLKSTTRSEKTIRLCADDEEAPVFTLSYQEALDKEMLWKFTEYVFYKIIGAGPDTWEVFKK